MHIDENLHGDNAFCFIDREQGKDGIGEAQNGPTKRQPPCVPMAKVPGERPKESHGHKTRTPYGSVGVSNLKKRHAFGELLQQGPDTLYVPPLLVWMR